MIPKYSLRIIFQASRSKNFPQALKLASEFNDFTKGDQNIVNVNMREIFEKWEYFNLLFWRVVDWKGTVLEWEGMEFHSHSDKTRIFYALQHAHISFICFLEDKIRELYKVPLGELKYEDLDMVYSERDMNRLLDIFMIVKRKRDVNDDEFFKSINVRQRPHFLQNKMKFNSDYFE